MVIRRKVAVLLGLLGLVSTVRADEPDDPKTPKNRYVRLTTDDDGTVTAMQTSIVQFTGDGGVQVDLVGVVHIGDKNYYAGLNDAFKSYDAVLYELVAHEGARPPKPGQPRQPAGSGVTAAQRTMKRMLELQFQLDQIDYTRPNMIHADMTPDEMAKSMKDRDESFLKMFFRMMGQSMAMQSKGAGGNSDVQLFAALFAKDRARRLKRIMASQFNDMEGQMELFNGPDGSTLITERNKKAFRVLRRELAAGKRRIAVFYGAGHLPDMEQRLIADFGMKRQGEKWLTAWDLK